MTRRLVRFAPLLLLLLAGCVTYTDGYYRDGYYSDGGYYYPAEDGYGDYYAGQDYDDYDYYYDYGYSSYTPFWSLSRYGCGAWTSCSPYWNHYYGRPYSGWSLSFGNHWSWGYWGWYGHHWSPWYDHGYYPSRPPVHRPPPPQPIDTAHGVGGVRPQPMPRSDFRDGYPGGKPYAPGDGRLMPRGDFRGNGGGKPYAPGDGRLAPSPQPDPAERPARPVPRSDFRDDRQNGKGYGPGDGRVMPQPTPTPRHGSRYPGGTAVENSPPPTPRPMPRGDFRGNGGGKNYAPSDRRVMPQPAAQSRYERPMVRETTRPTAPPPRYQAPAPRQPSPAPRYERPVPRETARPAPAPRQAPPPRPTRETRPSSQNGTRDDEP